MILPFKYLSDCCWFFFLMLKLKLVKIPQSSPISRNRVVKSERKMGIVERIKEIEAEMARTQKNKATGFFLHYITYRHESHH